MAKTVLFPGQFLLDRRDQARIVGFHGGGKCRLQTAVAADQIFMEIPARGLQRAFLCRPFVERMGIRALDRDIFGEREGDMVVTLAVFSISLTPPGSWPPKSLDGTASTMRPLPR